LSQNLNQIQSKNKCTCRVALKSKEWSKAKYDKDRIVIDANYKTCRSYYTKRFRFSVIHCGKRDT
jgi:hypothetical protein